MNTGVLGGGALGLTVAYRLAQAGDKVTLIEKESEVGGLAAGFLVGDSGTYLEKFYHHIFKTDTTIVELIKELGLGDKFEWMRPVTSMWIGGQAVQLDSPTAVLKYKPLSLFSRFRLAAGLAYLKLEGNYHRLEKVTAAQWVRKWMGNQVYDKVWGPQLAGKFGAVADTIVASWLWARIKDRTTQLGYLHGGFQQIYNRLADGIRAEGGDILLGETVTSIARQPDGKVNVKLADGREFNFDRLVCTFPSRLFVRLAQGLPADYVAKYNWGQAYGATCLILALNQQVIERTYWMSILEPDYPFLAAVEHTNLISPKEYGGARLLYLGNYLPMDHPLFGKSAEEVLEEYTPYIKKLNPNFDKSWITQMYFWKAAYAQPIVTVDYKDHIPPHDTPLPNVYVANMFQVYPHDRGQNYSIEMANQLADRLISTSSQK